MKFSLRRLIITIIFVLIVGATSIAAVFISEFDLNHFRAQISDSMSSRLSQPADLGKAHFSIKHGPSFAFSNVLVGTKDGPLHLTADKIFFRLEVLPLLIGDFRFSEILFEKPNITLKTGRKTSESSRSDRLVIDQSVFSGTLVRSIRIHNGNFRLEDYSRSDTPFIVGLEKMRLVIDDLSLRQSGWVEIQADVNCNNIRSPLKLSGYIKAGDSTPFWNHANFDLEMTINDFASDVLSNRYQRLFSRFRIEGRTDIKTRLSGSPAKGLDFNTTLTGRDLGLKLPGRAAPVAAGNISVKGNWQNLEQLHKIEGMQLSFGPLHVTADATIDLSLSEPQISATIRAPRVPLAELNRFLPTDSKFSLRAGTLALNHLNVSGPLNTLKSAGILSAINKLDLDLLKGEFRLGYKNFSDLNLAIAWENRNITLEQFQLSTNGVQLTSEGILDITPGTHPGELTLSGKWDLKLNNSIRVKKSAKRFLPENGLKAVLHLDAGYVDGSWTFKDNLLALPSVQMILQGNYAFRNNRDYSFDITIPEFSLGDLPLISPAISAIKPGGKLSGNITLTGNADTPADLTGEIKLNAASLHIAGPLADLTNLDGSIHLDWPAVRGTGLRARLGESPISLGLDIPDLTISKVNMTIKGDSIRADELIFRSDKAYLRDVDANLSITDNALYLGPIDIRMDRGTNVTVNGTVNNFPIADTRLRIEGRYGNIDEVISLWLSDKQRQAKKKSRKKVGLLEIDIKTEAGEIANLPFEESEGRITYRDRTLIIHPIKFKSGPGSGIGQVLVKYRDNQPPLMRISGHLENFDALAVYQQLLQRKGIVTGKLWGDFYLEGTAGNLRDVFLPSSFGAFDFVVRDGVLKKLRGLSSALTLFNIYPIFTSSGKERGVPFATLTGNAYLDKGILRSDNASIQGDVMNLSMTGTQNLISGEVNLELGVMPLRTIDRLITKIPLAGWILAGEDKALVTAHFKLTGPGADPKVEAIPIESASKQVLGVFKRLFTLPVKIVSDINEAIE